MWRVIGVAVGAGVLVAACGSSGPASSGVANESASQIFTAAINAMKSASSGSVSGSEAESGKAAQVSGTFFADDADVTLVTNGETIKVIKVGANDYIQGPSAYWASNGLPSADFPKVNGVWVSIPDSTAHLGSVFTLSGFATSLTADAGTLTKGATSTIGGQAVIAIISSTQNGTLYVATTGTPYPVEVTKSGSGGGTLTFSGWNQGSTPTAPAGAKTIAQLGLVTSGSSGASGSSTTAPSGGSGASGTPSS
jgi:hypothetical protein